MHQSVYELVHTEDQQALRRNLHWALNPPTTASAITQDSPQGDHALLLLYTVYDNIYNIYSLLLRPQQNWEILVVLNQGFWSETLYVQHTRPMHYYICKDVG